VGTTYHVMNGTEKVGDEIVVASVTKQQQRRGEKENLKYTVLSCARYTVHENLTLLKMLGDDKYDMHSRLSAYVKLIHDFTGLWRSAVAIYMGVCVHVFVMLRSQRSVCADWVVSGVNDNAYSKCPKGNLNLCARFG